MKLIIQIPCYNEAETLPETLADLPRELPGVDVIEWLVIDDGSTDGTSDVARLYGVDHIVRHTTNRGLAAAFRSGIDACLKLGADIIVNTDGDNQYPGSEIGRLIAPIVRESADIVLGNRQTDSIHHFSLVKRLLQRWGSFTVRQLSGTRTPDAVSGFRAFSRSAAMQLNVVSEFSYTIETLIQAGSKRLAVESVPVHTNPVTRQSRLFRSIPQFVTRSATTMLRMYAMYHPLRVFALIGIVPLVIGIIPVIRFLLLYLAGSPEGHVQSLVLGAACLIIGFFIILFGLLADLISNNRRLTEQCLTRLRELESQSSTASDHRQPFDSARTDEWTTPSSEEYAS